MVIIGMDTEYFFFEDPRLLNNVMYIGKAEFMTRWHDFINSEQRIANRCGIVIRNKDGSKPERR